MNKTAKLLFENKIIKKENIQVFSNRTRDNKDLKVFEDIKSGLVFLKNKTKLDINYYKNKKNKKYFSKPNLNLRKRDAKRRFNQFEKYFKNKKILDYGSGNCEFVNYLKNKKYNIFGYEPQKNLNKNRYIFSNFADFENLKFDVITLFHVLEHLDDPIKYLKQIKTITNKNGRIIIEVPHANDFLLKKSNLNEFKNFTLWSEHYILHTATSLNKFLKIAGFKNIKIKYFQRYNIYNHILKSHFY